MNFKIIIFLILLIKCMFKKLNIIRHGQSRWNVENRFTGWIDSKLTNEGKNQVIKAAKDLISTNNIPDIIYCSEQKRSIESSNIIINELKYYNKNIILKKDWRLNERYWGTLTGYKKNFIENIYGKEYLNNIIYSYNKKFPILSSKKLVIPKYKSGNYLDNFKNGETTKDIINRIKPFLDKKIINENNKNVLIVGHSHTLRSIIIYLKNIKDTKEIKNIKIMNAISKQILF